MTTRALTIPDLDLLRGTVAPEVLEAMHAASKALEKVNVPHFLIGGLAVGAYGYVRATRDVDFLVGEEAFMQHGGGLLTFRPGVPYAFEGVPVDLIAVDPGDFFDPEIMVRSAPWGSRGVPIAPIEVLILLKLRAHRRRDKEDIVELIQAGAVDVTEVLEYLEEFDPGTVRLFSDLVEEAGDA